MPIKLRYWYGWVVVRPRRWLFSRMIWRGSFGLRWKFERHYDNSLRWPNLHWWLLYKTVFKFCSWLQWRGCRLFDRKPDPGAPRWRRRTWASRLVGRIGQTTAGYHCGGGECFHCGHPAGCQVALVDAGCFECEGTATVETQDGTDHRFWGVTTCSQCGYRMGYDDGSL